MQYHSLSQDEKETTAKLGDDICVIKHQDHTDHFIRVILEVPIHGAVHPFTWGVWISVSKSNFKKYTDHFRDEAYEDKYFGWLCNALPFYPQTIQLKASASVKPGGERPRIQLEPTDHPLSIDSREGVSWQKAVAIAQVAMHPKANGNPDLK